MNLDFKRRGPTSSQFYPYDTPRRHQENIVDEYMKIWNLSPSIINEKLRSCEQKLIKLDKIELQDFLQQFVRKQYQVLRSYHIFEETAGMYTSCVLLHLIHVFCIPGQEEKMEVVQEKLNNDLLTSSEKDRYDIFAKYLSQQLKVKRNLTEIDFLNGKIDPEDEFELKLCYWNKIYYKNDTEGCKEFLNKNADFLVFNIERMASNYYRYSEYVGDENFTFISCKILLCLLNWNICQTQTTVILHNREAPDSSSVADASVYCTVLNKISNTLQKLLTLFFFSEHDVITIFNNYFEQMYAMKSEITEDGLCTGKIEQHHECMLKLCYCEKLIKEKDHETYKKFLRRNANLFASQLEKMVDGNTIKSKIISCEMLLNLLKTFNKKTPTFQDHIKDILIILLADELFLFSTKQINEAFYLYLKKSCVSNHNFMFQLAKTFLDISINPKISKHKKSTIEGKIQPILISHDTSKTVLPATTDFSNIPKIKMEHKRIINLCINVVKTESKDINIPMYEDIFWTEKKAIENEVEMIKRSQETETLVLLMLLLITITSTGHHKSAKLKKYLTHKYEYATASLHLLWCSGDIEVHPGPSLNKKTLAHDSSIERRWIQNISPRFLVLLPEHEQPKYKPTKKVRSDMENREHFKTLLKTCLGEKVHVPKMYLAEINAWETKEYQLLHKLFVYRCEIETIITSLQDFFICGGSTKDLTDINVSLDTELKTNDITTILGKGHRPIDKSQLMVYITRHIAGISIKCAHEKDPDAKCDGLWDLPLKNWPKQIILFDPKNRGKYTTPGQKLIPDQELVDILLTLPQVTIPQKYKEIVEAFRTMRKSQKDKSINKQHKAELCSTFKRITSLEKLDYALKNLWESGIFTEEVHNNLNKWWTTGAVDTPDDQNVSQVDIIEVQKSRRPHIFINISTKSVTLTVEQTDAKSSQVRYDISLKDELVPLKTIATTVHQTTVQKPSSDSYQMFTAKKYLTVSSKEDACPADNKTYSIIIPPLDLNPNSQEILESDIKHQHNISTEETALCTMIDFDQLTSSTKQISQLSKTIATPNQSITNSDDTSSATKDSQSLHFHTQVSPISDIGSSDSISLVNSKSGNDDGDQTDISNGGQVISTDSDYSSDSSNNFVSKTNIQKRKFTEEDRNEMKKRKRPSQEDKKPIEPNHRQMDCLMDNTASFDKNREILPDWLLDIDLDSYDIDNQTFKVDQNALDNEDTELVKFLQDFIDCESEINVTNEII